MCKYTKVLLNYYYATFAKVRLATLQGGSFLFAVAEEVCFSFRFVNYLLLFGPDVF